MSNLRTFMWNTFEFWFLRESKTLRGEGCGVGGDCGQLQTRPQQNLAHFLSQNLDHCHLAGGCLGLASCWGWGGGTQCKVYTSTQHGPQHHLTLHTPTWPSLVETCKVCIAAAAARFVGDSDFGWRTGHMRMNNMTILTTTLFVGLIHM